MPASVALIGEHFILRILQILFVYFNLCFNEYCTELKYNYSPLTNYLIFIMPNNAISILQTQIRQTTHYNHIKQPSITVVKILIFLSNS